MKWRRRRRRDWRRLREQRRIEGAREEGRGGWEGKVLGKEVKNEEEDG